MCITVPAKEEMHGLDFIFCPIRLIIILRWILAMKPQAGGQVLKNQRELFLHTPGSWCSCVQAQDFPHCSVVMIINVAALARSCIGKQDLRGKKSKNWWQIYHQFIPQVTRITPCAYSEITSQPKWDISVRLQGELLTSKSKSLTPGPSGETKLTSGWLSLLPHRFPNIARPYLLSSRPTPPL